MADENNAFQDLLGKAMQFQERIKAVEAQLKNVTVTGEAGGGLVKVTMSASGDCRRVEIEDGLYNSGDKAFMEDLLAAAVNQALRESKKISDEAMSKAAMDVTGIDPTKMTE